MRQLNIVALHQKRKAFFLPIKRPNTIEILLIPYLNAKSWDRIKYVLDFLSFPIFHPGVLMTKTGD